MENPIKMDDLGVPLFSETPMYIYIYKMRLLEMLIEFIFLNYHVFDLQAFKPSRLLREVGMHFAFI